MAELTILDVGHGNCAVLTDDRGTTIIDAGLGGTLLEFLEDRGITVINTVLVSHADSDHIYGITSLLLSQTITVVDVYLNSDSRRDGMRWKSIRTAFADARQRKGTRFHIALTTVTSDTLVADGTQVEVLAPVPELAVSGVGGTDLGGRRITANSLSAVLRIVHNGRPQVLFAGDIDDVGLDNLLATASEATAPILIFPHHGGNPGSGNPYQFARRLCEAVQPNVIIFSIGRTNEGTPLPQIILGIRQAVPDCHILCTELSKSCAAAPPTQAPLHIGNRPAKGRTGNACCAGTLVLDISDAGRSLTPSIDDHRAFVAESAPTALCRTGMQQGIQVMGVGNV